jgi:hypothetical protein
VPSLYYTVDGMRFKSSKIGVNKMYVVSGLTVAGSLIDYVQVFVQLSRVIVPLSMPAVYRLESTNIS